MTRTQITEDFRDSRLFLSEIKAKINGRSKLTQMTKKLMILSDIFVSIYSPFYNAFSSIQPGDNILP